MRLDKLFAVKYGVNLELNSLEVVSDDDRSGVNFVGRTSANNGVVARVRRVEGIEPQAAGLLSCAGGGSVLSTFVQSEPFYSGRDLYVLTPKQNMSLQEKLFYCMCIQANAYRYNYGRQANKTLREIELPDQVPAWAKDTPVSPIRTLVVPEEYAARVLNIKAWQPFMVSQLFSIRNGKGITKEEIESNPGTFIAVQSGEENNGCMGLIDKEYCLQMRYTLTDLPCLTVARSGSAGYVSYQQKGCVVGDSAKILLLKNERANNPYVLLFLKTVLMANKYKFTYGRKVTEQNYMSEIIRLPAISENGHITPDWQYMENYMKSLPYSDKLTLRR